MFDTHIITSPVKHSFTAGAYYKSGCNYTFEWRWPTGDSDKWRRASQEGFDGTYEDGLLRPEDTDKLLDAFGLLNYDDAPVFEVLINMPPTDLIKLRRKREYEELLPFFLVLNDRMHERNPAEFYH